MWTRRRVSSDRGPQDARDRREPNIDGPRPSAHRPSGVQYCPCPHLLRLLPQRKPPQPPHRVRRSRSTRHSPASGACRSLSTNPIKPTRPARPSARSSRPASKSMAAEKIEIPLIIGGKEIRTGKTEKSVMPHDHRHVLAEYHVAGPEHVAAGDRRGRRRAPRMGRAGRGKIAPPSCCAPPSCSRRRWRATINAATMLGQSKTVFQAEIDAASRDDRLLALQRLLRAGALRRAADQQPGRVELDGVPRRSKASSTPSRRSTSRRSAAT